MTRFGRALAELNMEILCANSSQAKGRVKREWTARLKFEPWACSATSLQPTE